MASSTVFNLRKDNNWGNEKMIDIEENIEDLGEGIEESVLDVEKILEGGMELIEGILE